MTLGRQLFISFILVVVLVIVSAFVISVKNTHDYLGAQLESNAHDAAVSLGMSLSSIVDEEDQLLIERTVDSLFDGGYYSQIQVKSLNGKTNINKQTGSTLEGIPDWFIRSLPLNPPVMNALVMGGWSEWGAVYVRSNSGYAYEQLWGSFVNMLVLALTMIIVTIAIVYWLLKSILTPLKHIEGQANAIANREFPVMKHIPTTREFKSVVLAMNKMTNKLIQMVSEHSRVADNLHKEAYTDEITGVGNRRSFVMRLDQITKESDDTHQALIAILKVGDLSAINRDHGFKSGNEIVTVIADELRDILDDDAHIARMGAAFGILVAHVASESIDSLASQIMSKVNALSLSDVKHVDLHLGVTIYTGSQNTRELLSGADMALRQAELHGAHSYHVLTGDNDTQVKGGEEWRDEIQAIIADHRVELVYQPVRMFDEDEPAQYEALAKFIGDNGDSIPAGIILPIADRYHLTKDIDMIIVEKIFVDLGSDWGKDKLLNINLSIQSVCDPKFHARLEALVNNNLELAQRLIIEVSEHQYHRNSDEYISFLEQFRLYGVRFSIDQFGINSTAFGFLQGLKLDQLKVDGSYVSNLHVNKDNQFFLRSLTDIAHNLDIKIIANFVEKEEELKSVAMLGMDGVQGYYVGKPQHKPD